MMVEEARFWVKLISGDALAQYMGFRDHTVRSLAAEVDSEVRKMAKKHADVPAEISSRSIIGHLRSGKRTTCQWWTARAIEKCLNAPTGSLFVPQVSRVSRPQRTAA